VRLVVWPDSREFPVPEMEAKGRKTHIWEVNRFPVAIDVPRDFRCWVANANCELPAPLASLNSSSENALAREGSLFVPEHESVLDSRTPVRTILSYHLGKYFRRYAQLLVRQR
jgi:hypothetical protein